MGSIYVAFSVLPEKRLFQEERGRISRAFCFRMGLGQCRVELLFGIVLGTEFGPRFVRNFVLTDQKKRKHS